MAQWFINGCIATVLVCAVLSGIAWVGLSFTWWRMEKNRIRKTKEFV